MTAPALVKCSKCGELMMPHRVCKNCGSYNKKEIIPQDLSLIHILPEKTVLCTFNFSGLSGEEVFIEENGRYIWENQGIACINILVDHPLYYHSKLAKPCLLYTSRCV